MENYHKNKIVVIGAGNVGEAIAYTLMVRRQANDIVLIDVNEKRARGAAIDISHGTSFHKEIQIRQGDYEECTDAGIIIITAGIARKPGQSRLELAKTNVSIVKSITENVMKYAKNPLILVVANPADILTKAVQQFSGLPAERVMGSGTSLDTARFRRNISDQMHVNVLDVNAYILGEHGDSQVAIWSSATVGGFSLEEYMKQTGLQMDKAEVTEHTKNGGAEIIDLKGATFYGVAMAVSTIVETIIRNDKAILSVAHVLDKEFGEWSGIAFSLPCRVGRNGIEKAFWPSVNEKEKMALDASAKVLKEFCMQVLA